MSRSPVEYVDPNLQADRLARDAMRRVIHRLGSTGFERIFGITHRTAQRLYAMRVQVSPSLATDVADFLDKAPDATAEMAREMDILRTWGRLNHA